MFLFSFWNKQLVMTKHFHSVWYTQVFYLLLTQELILLDSHFHSLYLLPPEYIPPVQLRVLMLLCHYALKNQIPAFSSSDNNDSPSSIIICMCQCICQYLFQRIMHIHSVYPVFISSIGKWKLSDGVFLLSYDNIPIYVPIMEYIIFF